MSKPKLTYFDLSASRGEECRLALSIAGVDFEDIRVPRAEWADLKPRTPFGGLPLFEVEGHPVVAQSNAILVLIGRRHDMHPKDDFEAARHEGVLHHVEDLRATVAATGRLADDEKKKAREALVAGYLPAWATFAERQIADDGPFLAGAKVHVVDVKLHMAVRLITSGVLDHIPTTTFAPFTKLVRVHDAVRDHEAVKAWNAKKR